MASGKSGRTNNERLSEIEYDMNNIKNKQGNVFDLISMIVETRLDNELIHTQLNNLFQLIRESAFSFDNLQTYIKDRNVRYLIINSLADLIKDKNVQDIVYNSIKSVCEDKTEQINSWLIKGFEKKFKIWIGGKVIAMWIVIILFLTALVFGYIQNNSFSNALKKLNPEIKKEKVEKKEKK